MKILIDTSDEQTLGIIPRFYPNQINYTLVEESSDRTANGTVVTAVVSGLLTFSDKFQLNEDNYYSLYVYDDATGELIHRDKVFCTNQTAEAYTINNGVYIQDTTYDNDYIIYGDDNTKPDTPTLISVDEV